MERIFVTVRARPLSPEDSKTSPWRISGNSISLAGGLPFKFEFDRIFEEYSKTVEVYEARTKDIVASSVRGFNGTVFAYGQTSSGKTYTMRGTLEEPGIIPMAVHDLFQIIEEDLDREFLVRMSYLEIYNEEVNDLLAPEHRRLQIHESLERGIYVAGLREEIVASPEQVLDLMEFGESHRHIGETNMNLYSSRSHTIFRMIIESRERIQEGTADSCDAVRVSALNLVDLAGSERAAKTGAEGMRLKEGSHINKSLMTLGSVIKKLSEGAESQGGHVPYRDSKLTRILQPALGGNANTAIICNITLAQVHTDETKSSLLFASRALRVQNCASVNEILTDAALLKRQRKEIEELRAKLLASHSEHWEEEIMSLRNTLLKSELEKERIALELQEEKKAKAESEMRLQEQERKIENLSSLVLYSERDDKDSYISKNKRRVTWCPGALSQRCVNEARLSEVALTSDPLSDEQDLYELVPFKQLMQKSELVDEMHHCDVNDNYEDLLLPDAQALLHVTSRRKIRRNRDEPSMGTSESLTKQAEYVDDSPNNDCEGKVRYTEFESLRNKPLESENPCKVNLHSSPPGCKNLTVRESEAIVVIKQLEDKIKSLETEKIFMQRQLDDVVDLATKQNTSFVEQYEELRQEAENSRTAITIAHEQLASARLAGIHKELELAAGLSSEVASEVHLLKGIVDNLPPLIADHFRNFSTVTEALLELKQFAMQDVKEVNSIVSKHVLLQCCMRKKIDELESEKFILRSRFIDCERQISELKTDQDDREKLAAERDLQHDMEKDELLYQILTLQKEVSLLSSSTLAKEKETLRKELDKTKDKLKDTEFKMKNSIQEKIKLQSEKAHLERDLKQLNGQKSLLERDVRKQDSGNYGRREPRLSELSKPKGVNSITEQPLQADYHRLEVYAFELEAQNTFLSEELIAAVEEKEKLLDQNEMFKSELQILTSNLTTENTGKKLLEEELASLVKKLAKSESLLKELESSREMISREKDDMAMQLTDALLDSEAEKSAWLAKEKSFIEANERLNACHDEITRLSANLLEVKEQLASSEVECARLTKELICAEENVQREKENSMDKGYEITQLTEKLNQSIQNRAETSDMMKKMEMLLSAQQCTSEEIQKLQEQLTLLTQERDNLLHELKNRNGGANLLHGNQGNLLSTDDTPLDGVGMETTKENYGSTLLNARNCVEELRIKISTMEASMHNKALENIKERTKLRMRLRHTQAKLDAFRGRYKELGDEVELMNKKYEDASRKLKQQLASYGHEILRLKKELKTTE